MKEKRIDYFLINSLNEKQTKGGKPYTVLQVFERGGRVWQVMYWEKAEGITSGDVIKAQVEETEYNGTLQLNAEKIRRLTAEEQREKLYEPEYFLPRTPYDVDAMLTELSDIVATITDGNLRVLITDGFIRDERLRRAAAAKAMHHAYLGGLLEHTLSMCRVANVLAPMYPLVNRDLLLTGCALHDFGKIEELSSGATIEYTVEGELIGHIAIGIIKAADLMAKMNMPDETRMRVLHLIGSHHGQRAYGAIKEPLTPEASLLCAIDGLDAEQAAIKAAFDKASPSATWTDKVKYEKRYYIGPPAPKSEATPAEEAF